MALVCTPTKRLSTYKCLSCLSVSELLALLVIIEADNTRSGYTLPGDGAKLMQDAACWTCLTDKQLLQSIVSARAEFIESTTTVQDIRNKIKCLLCGNPKQIKAALAMLTCKNSTA